jgi:hypothetical protein
MSMQPIYGYGFLTPDRGGGSCGVPERHSGDPYSW